MSLKDIELWSAIAEATVDNNGLYSPIGTLVAESQDQE